MAATNDSANQFTSEAFLNPYGMFMPQKRRELLAFQRDEYYSLEIFQELKMSEPVEAQTFYFFVEPKKTVNLIAAAAASAGATDAAVDIVIKNTVGISGGVFARGREILRRRSGQQLIVVAVNKSTSTITVKAKTGAAVEAVDAGEIFAIIGNASPEASSYRVPLTGVTREISNNTQIMQEIAQSSGSVQTDKLWFDVPQPKNATGNNAAVQKWFSWEVQRAWDNLSKQRANTMIVSKRETYDITAYVANFTDKSITSVYTTSSVVDQYVAEGNQKYYTPTTLNFAWYNAMENILIKNQGDRENIMFGGIDFIHENSSWITDMFKNGAISYGTFNQSASAMRDQETGESESKMVTGKELAIKMGFSSFATPTGFSWHWKAICEFNDPDGLGEIGFTQNAVVIPTQPMRIAGKGTMQKPIRTRYKNLPNGGNVAIGFVNGVRNTTTPTSNGDFDSVLIFCEEGMEVLVPWKGLFVTPQ